MQDAPFGSLNPRDNIDDRRGEMTNMSIGDLLRMLGAPLPQPKPGEETAPPVTPLGIDAGINDIVPGHGRWLLKRMMDDARAKADNAVHTFNERIQPLAKRRP